MQILVTGTDGQVARSLRERGGEMLGAEVICVGRPHLDLARPETIETAVRAVSPDVIVSAGAYTDVSTATRRQHSILQMPC